MKNFGDMLDISMELPPEDEEFICQEIKSIFDLAFHSNLRLDQIIDIVHSYLFLSTNNTKKAKEIFPFKSKNKLIKLNQIDSLRLASVLLSMMVDIAEKIENGEFDVEEED